MSRLPVCSGQDAIRAFQKLGYQLDHPLDTVELPERTEVEFAPRPVVQPEVLDGHLDGIYAVLGERYQSGEHDAAARHNARQP